MFFSAYLVFEENRANCSDTFVAFAVVVKSLILPEGLLDIHSHCQITASSGRACHACVWP